jgi:hypothetical protein
VDNEKWYFSIVDVVAVLTDSENPQTYWRVLKKRLLDEGNETVTNCNALKMKAADGKMRLTDVADTEQLLRLIQSIPSKKAEGKEAVTPLNAKSLKGLADKNRMTRTNFSGGFISERMGSSICNA